jgi:hypothetical protein
MPIVLDSLKVSRGCLRARSKTDSMRCDALIHSTGGTESCNRGVNENFRVPRVSSVAFWVPTFGIRSFPLCCRAPTEWSTRVTLDWSQVSTSLD